MRIWLALVFECACAALLCAQSSDAGTNAQQRSSGDGSARVAGVIPAFNSCDDVNAPGLSARQKFHLFSKTTTDPFTLIMPAVNALILNSAGVSSGYGSGFSGWSKRYASSLADTTTGNLFRLYAYPAMLHEDPRYFRAAHGSIGERTKRVLSAPFVTREDTPEFRFNWSKLLASATSAGLSNAYYPAENRGAELTLSRIGLSYVTEIGYNALKEFWPDVAGKLKRKRSKSDTSSTAALPP